MVMSDDAMLYQTTYMT